MAPSLRKYSAIWLTGGSFFALLIAVAIGTVWVVRAASAEREHRAKLALMPSFYELDAARARLQETRHQISEETERINEIRKQIAEGERDRVDARHWQTIVEESKREYESLEDKRREVDEVREHFEDAAKDLAARRQEISNSIADRDRLLGRLNA